MREGTPGFNPESEPSSSSPSNQPIEGEYVSEEQFQEYQRAKQEQRPLGQRPPEDFAETISPFAGKIRELGQSEDREKAWTDYLKTPESQIDYQDHFELGSTEDMVHLLDEELEGTGEPKTSPEEMRAILSRTREEQLRTRDARLQAWKESEATQKQKAEDEKKLKELRNRLGLPENGTESSG